MVVVFIDFAIVAQPVHKVYIVSIYFQSFVCVLGWS